MRKKNSQAGFTLIEMIVAVALFSIVMLIAGATLMSLVYANRKAQALQSVMNNLNIALDDMVRNIRTGSGYNCDAATGGDCSAGGNSFYFTPFDAQGQEEYLFGGNCLSGRICVEDPAGSTPEPITAPEVGIINMEFYVVGTSPGAGQQPKVLIAIQGEAGSQSAASTTFDIQATAVQRVLNL